MADHFEEFFDALLCEQGHVINKVSIRDQTLASDAPFCGTCGTKTSRTCGHCSGYIRGAPKRGKTERFPSGRAIKMYDPQESPYSAPAYCEKCGHAFPWTEAKLLAGNDFVDLMEKLSPEEKARLKAALPALTVEGPGTAVAVARWKLALGKVGTDLYAIGVKVIGDLVTASVKGQLGL